MTLFGRKLLSQIAYTLDGSRAGGYTQIATCGLSVKGNDYTLIPVSVRAGEISAGIDGGDWYAPADAFPPHPVP
jgi:hypothetical protein